MAAAKGKKKDQDDQESAALRSEQREAALQEYEKGVRLLQQGDFEAAIPRFETVLEKYPDEAALGDRARIYLRVARGEVQSRAPKLATRAAEESYEVGVFLLNAGEYKDAVRHLERAAEHASQDGSVLVPLAAAQLHAGDRDGAIASLGRALELRPDLRYQVRNLSDFQELAHEPSFQAVVAKDG